MNPKKKPSLAILAVFISIPVLIFSLRKKEVNIPIIVYPDSVLNDISNNPIGINIDYFIDDDKFLNPKIHTADALKAMGVKYLRYPGGNKSDLYLFSNPPYKKASPSLARTGEAASGYDRAISKIKVRIR